MASGRTCESNQRNKAFEKAIMQSLSVKKLTMRAGTDCDSFQFGEQIKARFHTPSGVVRYARNLPLPKGEPRRLPAAAPSVIIGSEPERIHTDALR